MAGSVDENATVREARRIDNVPWCIANHVLFFVKVEADELGQSLQRVVGPVHGVRCDCNCHAINCENVELVDSKLKIGLRCCDLDIHHPR